MADFVEEAAPHGLVLAAFGSTIQSMVLTHTDLQELAKGFTSLAPTRVLWAMSDKGLPDGVQLGDLPLGSNTRVVSWVDYNVSVLEGGVAYWLLGKARDRFSKSLHAPLQGSRPNSCKHAAEQAVLQLLQPYACSCLPQTGFATTQQAGTDRLANTPAEHHCSIVVLAATRGVAAG